LLLLVHANRELEIKVLAGRLAGSAIISMPTSDLAQRALHELHGFLLHDKPMIIEFGKR
jgi:U11/U12 small nuclear ribonucleoprotein SNRNP65